MNRLVSYILFLLCLISCIKDKPSGADLSVGDRIPDFTVTMNDGTQVSAEQLREGICCIVFFTTVCPDCQQTLPHVQRVYDEYSHEGVKFVLISREEGPGTISEYWLEQGYTMPYSAQSDRTVYELFARTRVPRVYICRDGAIKSIFTDQPENPTYETLKVALDGALYKY